MPKHQLFLRIHRHESTNDKVSSSMAAKLKVLTDKFKVMTMNTRDWTTVPGWDEAKQEYVELDCERWIRENKIRELGRENGEREYPPSEAVQPDETYTKIRAWVNQRGKDCKAAVSKYLDGLRHNLELESEHGKAPIQDKVNGLKNEGITKLTDQARIDRSILTQREREARESQKALESFKKEANLDRVAEYHERDTWYLWLIGIVAIEAVANAIMLGKVLEQGLLGAIPIMGGIGVVNTCILAALIGEGWRHKNSLRRWSMVRGWVLVLAGVTGMVFWNLLVGHFRDSMSENAESRGEGLTDDTIERFMTNPMGLEEMLSWVLAVIGAGCCVFAATKWLGRDDEYPRYGKIYRAATEHLEELEQEVELRRQDLKDIYTTYVEKIRDSRRNEENKKGNHRLITDTAKRIQRQFTMQLRQYQDHLDFIIAAYRTANEKARGTPSPAFFANRITIDQEILKAPTWVNVEPTNGNEIWGAFRQAEEAVREAYEHARDGYLTPKVGIEAPKTG